MHKFAYYSSKENPTLIYKELIKIAFHNVWNKYLDKEMLSTYHKCIDFGSAT